MISEHNNDGLRGPNGYKPMANTIDNHHQPIPKHFSETPERHQQHFSEASLSCGGCGCGCGSAPIDTIDTDQSIHIYIYI